MFFAMFWLSLFTVFLPAVLTQTDNFGPYTVKWDKFEVCKGPKRSECGKVRIDNTNDMSDVIFLLDIDKDCPLTKARVTMVSKGSKSSSKKTLWNYSLDSPCQHFVLGPILIDSFKLNNNCKINKGNYEVHLNMTAKAAMFLGTKFFYGVYAFKVYAHNNNNNFFCVEAIVNVNKNN